jgi:hypothetical protein
MNEARTKLRLLGDGAEALKHLEIPIQYFHIHVCAIVGMSRQR